MKSTVDEIRARFDADVERFSNLETGQAAAIDSPLQMDLLTHAAAVATPKARSVLDIGCGAGNYTLKLLGRLPDLDVTLIDLSRPMLDRAVERIGAASRGAIDAIQGDIREIDLGVQRFDIVMAAQCLHHLRGDEEWQDVFRRVFDSLRPGGSFWIADSVEHDIPAVGQMIDGRWSDYLVGQQGPDYRDRVVAYVEKEDTPRPLQWQLDLLRAVGFSRIDVLHKHNRFASFGGAVPQVAENR
jgi:tRNA (cmo5U34)-methyltransferase